MEGRHTGDAFIELYSERDCPAALRKHRCTLGARYIEVIPSSSIDRENLLQQAKLRSKVRPMPSVPGMEWMSMWPMMDPSGTVLSPFPMLAPLMPMLPMQGTGMGAAAAFAEHVDAPPFVPSANSKAPALSCLSQGLEGSLLAIGEADNDVPEEEIQRPISRYIVRIRGLPFTSNEQDVAEFFDDVRIIPQGVHLVFNSREKPTGEAFVEVVDETDVNKAMEHNGGAMGHRYIEVFRSSPNDMQRLTESEMQSRVFFPPFAPLMPMPFMPMFPMPVPMPMVCDGVFESEPGAPPL
jgi:RNA recognition motif-containing protein